MVFRNLSCKSNDNKFQNDRNSFIKVVPITGYVWAESGLLPASNQHSMSKEGALTLQEKCCGVIYWYRGWKQLLSAGKKDSSKALALMRQDSVGLVLLVCSSAVKLTIVLLKLTTLPCSPNEWTKWIAFTFSLLSVASVRIHVISPLLDSHKRLSVVMTFCPATIKWWWWLCNEVLTTDSSYYLIFSVLRYY